MIRNHLELLSQIRDIHAAIRDAVVAACEQSALEQLAAPVAEEAGDTIFAIDRVSEATLLERFGALAAQWSCVLIAEGLGQTGQMVLPEGTPAEQAELRVIVDPIDGTRGVMYQKRPAWILTGVAVNRGPSTGLADIELAVMTEIPLVKQHLCDSFWAVAGAGAAGERINRLNGERLPLRPTPSQATTIAQGYGAIARFFPGARAALAAVDDELVERLLGPVRPGQALVFEDQYISTGGQMYELLMGHDRWLADLRPLTEPLLRARGLALGLCCHPYDLCAELIAREAGVIICDEHGERLSAPLSVDAEVAWAGFANRALAEQVGPVLRELLRAHGMLG
jgi:fructose-1,6-bisphosphatase/inositol monophosphatase family enzyme